MMIIRIPSISSVTFFASNFSVFLLSCDQMVHRFLVTTQNRNGPSTSNFWFEDISFIFVLFRKSQNYTSSRSISLYRRSSIYLTSSLSSWKTHFILLVLTATVFFVTNISIYVLLITFYSKEGEERELQWKFHRMKCKEAKKKEWNIEVM
jgi:hypothetical protein